MSDAHPSICTSVPSPSFTAPVVPMSIELGEDLVPPSHVVQCTDIQVPGRVTPYVALSGTSMRAFLVEEHPFRRVLVCDGDRAHHGEEVASSAVRSA